MKRKIGCLFRVLIFLIIVILCLFLGFRRKYQKAIFALSETQVKNATSDLLNDAIDRQIEAGDIHYDRMVYFEKDLDGRITALKTNMSEVNRLKTSVLNRINGDVLSMDTSQLGVPLGSLIFPEFLSGKGPDIPVKILTIRNSEASFDSNFTQAGINQTLHQIIMNLSVDVTVLVLGETNSFTVDSHVVVAETIIVGRVPDTFLQSGGL